MGRSDATTTAKITEALGIVQDLAAAKGLEQMFALELYSLEKTVEDALERNDAELAGKALRDARALWGQLRGTPGRYTALTALA